MRMKSLFLGGAAGLVAITGAQAADLPVKAKPVEYVKVCSAYGAGFYYIPGTDICLRVGGYVWSEFEINDYGAGPNFATGAIGADSIRNRNDNLSSFRTRFDMIFDARTNTEYGTLRSYASVGWQWTTNLDGYQQQQLPASTGNYAWYYDRAFIQFAGFTFGYVGSFFDFDPSMLLNQQTAKSFKFTPAVAYTAQLGSGISASISMEDSTTRRTNITTAVNGQALVNGGLGYYSPASTVVANAFATTTSTTGALGVVPVAILVSGFGSNIYAGQQMPDFVANLRVDQAWGDAQVSAAIHQLPTAVAGAGLVFDTLAAGLTGGANPVNGTPWTGTKYGYAFLGGMNFKLPMIAPGDSFQIEAAWSKGAPDYTGVSANPYSNASSLGYRNGATGPVIDLFDSYVDATGQHLPTAWSINAQFRHFWTPTLRSTIAYGYNKFNAPSQAQISTGGALINGTLGSEFPDGKIQQVTGNLIWSPVKNLDLGLEAYWVNMKTDCAGLSSVQCSAPTELTRGKSVNFEGGLFRARRDF